MLQVLTSVRSIWTEWLGSENRIDFVTSWLHYRLTVAGLLTWTLLLLATETFDNRMSCYQDGRSLPKRMMADVCRTGNLTIVQDRALGHSRSALSAVGLGPAQGTESERDKLYHNYYPWVSTFLVAQALFFFLPRWLWETKEAHTMNSLVQNLDCPTLDGARVAQGLDKQLNYLTTGLGHHALYASHFGLALVLNLANTVLQFWITDCFLGDSVDFVRYGTVALQNAKSPAKVREIIRARFPYWANCLVRKPGISGTIEHANLLCHLPLNMFNGMAFVFFWWWLAFLAAVTSLSLLYWLVFICSRRFRAQVLVWQASPFAQEAHVRAVAASLPRSDSFVLLLLGCNVERCHFGRLVSALASRLDSMPCSRCRSML